MANQRKRTVLITGGSRGIGRAIALAFGKAGYQVAVNYCSNKAKAEEAVAAITGLGGRAIALQADVADSAQVQAMCQAVWGVYGDVDVLINNAGIAIPNLFTDVTLAEWRRVFAVNVDGIYNTIQQVLPQMIHNKAGKIINISSIWGITGASCEVAYSATKAAVIGLTKALAKEVGPSNIQVNCIAPGVIATDMNGALSAETIRALQEETPLGRMGTPDDIAAASLYLASPGGDFMTGQVISPNGGFCI